MTKEEAIAELVLETTDQIGSNILNSGEWLSFLLNNGWTPEEINARLGEMVDNPEMIDIS